MAVLPNLAQQNEALEAKLADLEAQNLKLQQALAAKPSNGKLSFKVSEKGAVSVYGLQKFPVTLYASQWAAVIAAVPAMQEFIKAHANLLNSKGM